MNNEQLLPKIHLVVEKLMHLGGANYDKDKTTTEEDTKKGLIQRDFGIEEWDWPQGIGLYGLYKLQEFYGDDRYMTFFQHWYENNMDIGLPSKNINTTAPFLPLSNLLSHMENNPIYTQLCEDRAEWLMNGLPKTKEGGFQHVTSALGNRDGVCLHEEQVWVDTLVMAVLFLNQMGQMEKSKNCQTWVNEATHQFLLHVKYLYDKQTGLFHHGWSFERNDNFGGVFWCRGNSWFTYGVMDYLEACGEHMDIGVRTYLIDTFKAQAQALKALQAPSGLWHTVLTNTESYEEVSGSGAITAGILKGIKAGILDDSFKSVADKALQAICDNISENGTVLNVSAGTGIGMDAEHYKNIAILPMAYGQSLALLALCEGLKK